MKGKILMAMFLVASLLVGTFFVSAAVTGKNPIDHNSSIGVADVSHNVPEVSETKESTHLALLANEQDGIDHQFEGEEEHAD